MKPFRRDKLRRLVEAGRVVMVGSYHYDDMTGGDRKQAVAIKCAIMPADRSAAVFDGTTCYLYSSDFTGHGRAWQNDDDGTIHLHVHSNCNYDFRIV